MKVCYFGIYNPEYSRNKILISGLKKNGVEVVECHSNKKGFIKYLDLVIKFLKIPKDYDAMVVGYPGFQTVVLAKFICRKPIIFDAFLSIYDSMILDRKLFSKKSLKAYYFWWLDKISMSFADIVVFDTEEHIKFVSKEFGIKKEKFGRILIGAWTENFYPIADFKRNNEDPFFHVVFFGTFIPLQGITYIIKAAKILEKEKIIFTLIGSGQEKENCIKLSENLKLKNLVFLDKMSPELLRERISESDLCLGIFGDTEKAKRVIPNKVYEAVAMKMPVLTADTPALREVFDEREILMCNLADPKSIANKIIRAKENISNIREVAKMGYIKFTKTATPEILGGNLKKMVEELLK